MVDRASIVKLIEDTWTARRADDCAGTMAQFHKESRFRFVCSPDFGPFAETVQAQQVDGRMAELIAEWDLSGLRIDNIGIDGDTAYVRHTGEARNKRTGTRMKADVLDVIRVADGKIIEYTQFTDTYGVAKAAGMIPGV